MLLIVCDRLRAPTGAKMLRKSPGPLPRRVLEGATPHVRWGLSCLFLAIDQPLGLIVSVGGRPLTNNRFRVRLLDARSSICPSHRFFCRGTWLDDTPIKRIRPEIPLRARTGFGAAVCNIDSHSILPSLLFARSLSIGLKSNWREMVLQLFRVSAIAASLAIFLDNEVASDGWSNKVFESQTNKLFACGRYWCS
jgi:hypothetical protein